jgi:hypothetical protein
MTRKSARSEGMPCMPTVTHISTYIYVRYVHKCITYRPDDTASECPEGGQAKATGHLFGVCPTGTVTSASALTLSSLIQSRVFNAQLYVHACSNVSGLLSQKRGALWFLAPISQRTSFPNPYKDQFPQSAANASLTLRSCLTTSFGKQAFLLSVHQS